MNCYELTATLIPHPPVPCRAGDEEVERMKE